MGQAAPGGVKTSTRKAEGRGAKVMDRVCGICWVPGIFLRPEKTLLMTQFDPSRTTEAAKSWQ